MVVAEVRLLAKVERVARNDASSHARSRGHGPYHSLANHECSDWYRQSLPTKEDAKTMIET